MSDAWEDSGQNGEAARLTTRREGNRDDDHIGQTNERRLLTTRGQVRGPLFCAPHFTAIFQMNRCSALHQPSQRAAYAIAARCVGLRTALRFSYVHTAITTSIVCTRKSAPPAFLPQRASEAQKRPLPKRAKALSSRISSLRRSEEGSCTRYHGLLDRTP